MATRHDVEETKKRKLQGESEEKDDSNKRPRETDDAQPVQQDTLGEAKPGNAEAEKEADHQPSASAANHPSPGLPDHFQPTELWPLGQEDLEATLEAAGGGDAVLVVQHEKLQLTSEAMDEDHPQEDLDALVSAQRELTHMVDRRSASAMVPIPSPAEQSGLGPQCAVIASGIPPAEPETSTNQGTAEDNLAITVAAASKEPSKQYLAAKEEITRAVISPLPVGEAESGGMSWDRFPNYIGEGIKSRLLSLATLHLLKQGQYPAAVKEMASNSNKVLFGAAVNCELYQDRVLRALAQKLQVPLLAVDAAILKLDSDELKEEASTVADDMFDTNRPGSGFPGESFDFSDEEEPFGDKKDRDKETTDSLSRRFSGSRRPFSFAVTQSPTQTPNPPKEPKQPSAGASGQPSKQAADVATAFAKATEHDATPQVAPRKASDWGALQEAMTAAAAKVASLTSDVAELGECKPPGDGKPPSAAQAAGASAQESGEEAAAVEQAGTGTDPGMVLGKLTDTAADNTAQTQQAGATAAVLAPPAAEAGAQQATPAKPTTSAAVSTVAGPSVQQAAVVPKPPLAVGVPAAIGAAAAAKAPAPPPVLKRNLRVAYIGRPHPSVTANQERLDAIQSAITRLETQSGPNRLRDYLPALLLRQRAALAAAGKAGPQAGRMQSADAPPIGSLGRVHAVAGDRVEVVLDEPFPGGSALPGSKEKCIFTCNAGDLQQMEDKEDPWASSFRALFDVIKEECEKGPLIVSIQNMDRLIRSQAADHFRKLEALLAQLPPRCLIFACYCSRTLAREKAGAGGGMGGGMFGARLAMDLLPGMDEMAGFLDRLGRGPMGKGQKKSSKGKLLAKMFANTIELYSPNQEIHAKDWRKMIEGDVATMRQRANRVALRKALSRCGMECDDLEAVSIPDCQLGKREVEQVVGVAVAEQLSVDDEQQQLQQGQQQGQSDEDDKILWQEQQQDAQATPGEVQDVAHMGVEREPWVLKAQHIAVAAEAVKKLQQEAALQPERKALQDVSADQYERQLLTEVITPEEINVKFDDIGALEAVKTTLHEVVILPLQRPELFTRGSLTKPTKGLLLFGPPGTGKTMLAKAVASESGAHFINVNMSAITSKWFGEGERLVRALFSLAHKLSPAVIFIDEIDSFLSKRGQSNNEHEALRKMKNEFMQHWDGLRTRLSDRVLVLAATNRPMDLDDAVTRRMPRRIFVPLPDAANRAKILKVILKDEAIEEGFNVEEVASWTDGYSGSDLKNLCIAAAYFPIRQYLEEEKKRQASGGDGDAPDDKASKAGPAAGINGQHVVAVGPKMRYISVADFKEAMKQVTASVSNEAVSMSELKRWNDQYGEGGSRRTEALHYFT